LLSVKASTQNDFVYGELGRLNLISHRMFSVIKYWLKSTCSDSKYIKNTHLMLKNDTAVNESNVTNLVTYIKNLLTKLGFEHVWLNQGVENKELFLLILKQRIKNIWLINLPFHSNQQVSLMIARYIHVL
jgi:hypothetical protein